jgi:hypothetical protein
MECLKAIVVGSAVPCLADGGPLSCVPVLRSASRRTYVRAPASAAGHLPLFEPYVPAVIGRSVEPTT